jgi:hypothetical protein
VQELETGPLHRFQDWPNEQVPSGGGRRLYRLGRDRRPVSVARGREAFLVEPEHVSVPTFG